MKMTPKIEQIMRSEHAQTINEMLDAGRSPNNVQKYLASVGFDVSAPTLYKYSNMRRQGLLEDVGNAAAETALMPVEKDEQSALVLSPVGAESHAQKRLRTEIEALDALIDKGYEGIKKLDPNDVPPKLMMDAIRLKNELTGGSHAQLTEYGFSSLKQLEDKKWRLVVQFMMSFITEEQQAEVQRGVEEIEESVYSGTPWQDEYVRAKESGSNG